MMTPTKKLVTALSLFSALSVPMSALAYMSPYEVLLSPQYAWPTTPRESQEKVALQQAVSAERREREQAAAWAASSSSEAAHAAATESSVTSQNYNSYNEDDLDPEMRSLIRALERLQDNQEEARLRAQVLSDLEESGLLLIPEDSLHGGAPLLDSGKAGGKTTTITDVTGKGKGLDPIGKGPLVNSGAGSTFAFMLLLTAIGWTIRRAGRSSVAIAS